MSDRVIFILAFASGVPLLLWWQLQQRIRHPWRGRPSENPRPAWMGRHGLSAEEAELVADAVFRGEQLPDERLRAAATDWAGVLLRNERSSSSRTRRVLHGLLVAWAVVIAGLLVRSVLTGHADDVNWAILLMWAALAASVAWRRRKVHRALALNSAPAGHRVDEL